MDKNIPKMLAEIYKKLFTMNLSKEEDNFAQTSGNMLVEIHAIDKFMKNHKDDQPLAYEQWFNQIRLEFFINIDLISDIKYLSASSISTYNFFFKIREHEVGRIKGFVFIY